jgi:formylglycine-generating enzyme required for sulfatase activity
MPANQDLQTILRESLRAYEQARAAHLRSQQAADAEFTRTTADLTAAEKAERTRLEAEHRARHVTVAGEQARLGDLAAAVTSLEEAARTALAQAGLAHIAGAPVAVDDPPAKARRGDAEVTQLFVQAQTGYVALREAIYRLAQAQVAAGQWDAARQTLKPLLAEKEGPFYEAANEVQRASYLMPAQRALETEQWEAVRTTLEPWLKGHKSDEDAETLVCEGYYQQAAQQGKQKHWHAALMTMLTLLERNSNFKDTERQLKQVMQKSIEFVRVPGGAFTYDVGSKRVDLPEYRISRAPISFAQFRAFMLATGYCGDPSSSGDRPVTSVSWDDAMAFCRWAGLAPPTEKQWVKAVCTPETNRQLEVSDVAWEWCANPRESGGYALRKYNPGSSGGGCSFRFTYISSEARGGGFRVVAP